MKGLCVSGFHVYCDAWEADIGKVLDCEREPGNAKDGYAALIDRTVVSPTVLFSFLEKNLAAAATPCWEAYLPMSVRSPGLYRWYAPRFPFSLTWTAFSVAACTSWFARAIAWGGIVDESDPFGSGSPSLRCRYRSRAFSPARSCPRNRASLFSWLKIFRVGNFRGLNKRQKYFNNENFPNYSKSLGNAWLHGYHGWGVWLSCIFHMGYNCTLRKCQQLLNTDVRKLFYGTTGPLLRTNRRYLTHPHMYIVVGRTDREQLRSRINNDQFARYQQST